MTWFIALKEECLKRRSRLANCKKHSRVWGYGGYHKGYWSCAGEKGQMSLNSNYHLLNLRNDKQFEYDALEWLAGSQWKDLVGHISYLMRGGFGFFLPLVATFWEKNPAYDRKDCNIQKGNASFTWTENSQYLRCYALTSRSYAIEHVLVRDRHKGRAITRDKLRFAVLHCMDHAVKCWLLHRGSYIFMLSVS